MFIYFVNFPPLYLLSRLGWKRYVGFIKGQPAFASLTSKVFWMGTTAWDGPFLVILSGGSFKIGILCKYWFVLKPPLCLKLGHQRVRCESVRVTLIGIRSSHGVTQLKIYLYMSHQWERFNWIFVFFGTTVAKARYRAVGNQEFTHSDAHEISGSWELHCSSTGLHSAVSSLEGCISYRSRLYFHKIIIFEVWVILILKYSLISFSNTHPQTLKGFAYGEKCLKRRGYETSHSSPAVLVHILCRHCSPISSLSAFRMEGLFLNKNFV